MSYIGTIMEIANNKAYIFTQDCGMISIKSKEGYFVGQQLQFSTEEVSKNKFFNMSKAVMGLAAAVVVLMVGVPVILISAANSAAKEKAEIAATVSVDINPGISISVNEENIIIEAESTNGDGETLLAAVSLEGVCLEDAMSDIVAKAKELAYINDKNTAVMVAAALNPDAANENTDAYKESLNVIITQLNGKIEAADIIAVFVDDPAIISAAKENGISLGKQLLFTYAEKLGSVNISLDEISTLSVSDILKKVGAVDEDGKLKEDFEDSFNKVIKNETTETSETSETEAETTNITDEISTSEETTPTDDIDTDTEETDASSDDTDTDSTQTDKTTENTTAPPVTPSDEYNISVSTSGTKINFAWDKLTSSAVTYNGKEYSGFQYYKVVASATDSTPIYPDDGYIYYCENLSTGKYTLNLATDDYNKSPELVSGKSYYFSITYVFENGKFTSDSVRIKVPEYTTDNDDDDNDDPTSIEQPKLEVSACTDHLYFSWTGLEGSSAAYGGKTYENFSYYKIVASETNPNPSYPDDGYLYYTTDLSTTTWVHFFGCDDYNMSPELVPGKTYYFSITYVFENGKFTSNTVRASIPQSSEVSSNEISKPELTITQNGSTINFTWTTLDSDSVSYNGNDYSDFYYYKVVASETNPNPSYPDDGYLYYCCDINSNSWSCNIDCDDYNNNPTLESGKTYYFSITYVFANGKIVTNTVRVTIN